jgi:hypothetical protein
MLFDNFFMQKDYIESKSAFMLNRFYTGIKTSYSPKVSKNHFSGKEGSKKVSCVLFVGLKMVFSKTSPKMASKRRKKVIWKIYFYRYYRCVLLFQDFSLILPLIRASPLSPLEFSGFWPAEIQANTRTNNRQKAELRYLQN